MKQVNDLQAIRKTTDAQKQRGYAARLSMADAVSGRIPDPEMPAKASGTEKVVRETFSMPRSDESLIEQLRSRAAREGRLPSRSEVVRGALRWLAAADPDDLVKVLDHVERVKPGRK